MNKMKSFTLSFMSIFLTFLMLGTVFTPGAQAASTKKDPICLEVGQIVWVDGFAYKCYGVQRLQQFQPDTNPTVPTAPTTPTKTPTEKPKPTLPIPQALTPCTKIGEQRSAFNVIFKCAISNRKLLWQSITQHSQKVPDSALYHAPPALPPQIPAPILLGTPTESVVGTPIALSVTGGQGQGNVNYLVSGKGCYVGGSALFSLNAGVCGVIASKDSDGQYAQTVSAYKVFTFKGQPSPALIISNGSLNNTVGTPVTLSSYGGNGNPQVVFKTPVSGCSIQGNVLTATIKTICYVTATQEQFEKYGPSVSTTVGFGFASSQSELTITPSSKTVAKGTQIVLDTIGGSGTGTVTFKVSGNNCSLTGSILTSSEIGSCSVVATKASDGIFQPTFSKYAIYNFTPTPLIAQEPLKINNSNTTTDTSQEIVLHLTGGSGTGQQTYIVSGKDCSVSSIGVVSATSPTNCAVYAKKAADITYLVTISNTVVVTFIKPSLIRQDPLVINNQNVTVSTGQIVELALSGGSGTGVVKYSIAGAGCSIVGNSVASTIPTNCVISATKSEDSKYFANISNTVVITYIAPIVPPTPKPDVLEITNSNLNGLVNIPISLVANGSHGALVSYTVTSGGCSITGSNLTSNAPAQCSVLAVSRLEGSPNTIYSQPVTFKFSNAVTQLVLTNETLTVPAGTSITLTSSNGNGNKISYTTATGSTCLISGQTLSSATAAACPVQAIQLAEDGVKFNSSPSIIFNFTRPPQKPLTLSTGGITSATAQSSVPLTVTGGTTGGSVTYQVEGLGCSVVGDSLTAEIATSCSVVATMAGDAVYNTVTAPYVVINFTKKMQSPLTISNSITAVTVSESSTASITITTRGGSGSSPVTLSLGTVSTAGVCTISGNTLFANSASSCAVVASRGSDPTYSAIWSDPVVFTFVKP